MSNEVPTHTDLMVPPESLECMCSKNGCPIHDNGPCSICSKLFSECVCTGEQQAKAFEDAYKLSPEAQAAVDVIQARGELQVYCRYATISRISLPLPGNFTACPTIQVGADIIWQSPSDV